MDDETVFWKEYQRREDSHYEGFLSSIVQFIESLASFPSKDSLMHTVASGMDYSIVVLTINIIFLVVFIILIGITGEEAIGDVNSPKYMVIVQQVNIWLFFSVVGLVFFILLRLLPHSFKEHFDMCPHEVWINYWRTINVSYLMIIAVKLFRYGPFYHDTCYELVDLNVKSDNSYTFVFLELFVDTIQTVVFTTLPTHWSYIVFLCAVKMISHLSLITSCFSEMNRSNQKWFVEIVVLSMINIYLILAASSNTIIRSSTSIHLLGSQLMVQFHRHKYRLVQFLSSGVKYPLQCALLSADNVMDSLDLDGNGADGNTNTNSGRISGSLSGSSGGGDSGRSPAGSERHGPSRMMYGLKESLASGAIKAAALSDDLLLLLRLQETHYCRGGAEGSSGRGKAREQHLAQQPVNVRDLFQSAQDASPHQEALQHLHMVSPYCSIRADKELLGVLMRHFLLFATGHISSRLSLLPAASLRGLAELRITLEENSLYTAKDPLKHCKYLLRMIVNLDRGSRAAAGSAASDVQFNQYIRKSLVICHQLVKQLQGGSLTVNEADLSHFELSMECEQFDSDSVSLPSQYEGVRVEKYEVGLVLLDSVVEGVVRNTLQDCTDVAVPKSFLTLNELLNSAPRLNSFKVLFLDSVADCKLLRQLGYYGLTVLVTCSRAYLAPSSGDLSAAPAVVRSHCDYLFPLPCFLLDSKELIMWLEAPTTSEVLRRREREARAEEEKRQREQQEEVGSFRREAEPRQGGAGAAGGAAGVEGGGVSAVSLGDGVVEVFSTSDLNHEDTAVQGEEQQHQQNQGQEESAGLPVDLSVPPSSSTPFPSRSAPPVPRRSSLLSRFISPLVWFFRRTECGVTRIPPSQYENYSKWRLLNPTRSFFHHTNLVTCRLLLYMAHSIVHIYLRGGSLSFGGFNAVLLVTLLVVFRRYVYQWMIRHTIKIFSGLNLYYFWALVSLLYTTVNFLGLIVVLVQGQCSEQECGPIFSMSGRNDLVGSRVGDVFSGKSLIDFVTNGGGLFVGWLFHFCWPFRLIYIVISSLRVFFIVSLIVRRFVSDLLFRLILLLYVLLLIVALCVEVHSENLYRREYALLRSFLLQQHLVDWCEGVARGELRLELREVSEARTALMGYLTRRVTGGEIALNEDLLRFLSPMHFAGQKLTETTHLLLYSPSTRDTVEASASAASPAGLSSGAAYPTNSSSSPSPSSSSVALKNIFVLHDFFSLILLRFKDTVEALGIRLFLDVDPALTVVRVNQALISALVSGAVSRAISNVLRAQREQDLVYVKGISLAEKGLYRTSSSDTQQEILVIVKPLGQALDDKSPAPVYKFMDTRLMIVNVLDTSSYSINKDRDSSGQREKGAAGLRDTAGGTGRTREEEEDEEQQQLEALEGWSSLYSSDLSSEDMTAALVQDCGRRSDSSAYFAELAPLKHAHYGFYQRFTLPYKLSKESKKAAEYRASDRERGAGRRVMEDECAVQGVRREVRPLLEVYQQQWLLNKSRESSTAGMSEKSEWRRRNPSAARRSILFYVNRNPESVKEYGRYATLFEMHGWKCFSCIDAVHKETGSLELVPEALDAILIDSKVGDFLFNVILAARVKYGPALVVAVLSDSDAEIGRNSVFLTEITNVDVNLIKPISPEVLIDACNKNVISQLMLLK